MSVGDTRPGLMSSLENVLKNSGTNPAATKGQDHEGNMMRCPRYPPGFGPWRLDVLRVGLEIISPKKPAPIGTE